MLALIILLDQFSLNIYRDLPLGYETSELAIPLAYTALGRGWVQQVPKSMRMFFTLPLMHSEKIDDQKALITMQPDDEFVANHYKPILNHGRFPRRNAAHQRQNTEAEEEYLKNGGFF